MYISLLIEINNIIFPLQKVVNNLSETVRFRKKIKLYC